MSTHISAPVPRRKLNLTRGQDRVIGEVYGDSGPVLLLLHGWPFHRATFRRLIPILSRQMQCVLFDFPGAGDSSWQDSGDFSFPTMAGLMRSLMRAAGFAQYDVIAHDSGGSIARLMVGAPSPIRQLILLNTEIPGHRPPFIREFQWIARLPGGATAMQRLLRNRWYLHSPGGFGGCFENRTCLDAEFLRLFVDPLATDLHILAGQLHRLASIDWKLVDELRHVHRRIDVPVHFIWGANDRTFPLSQLMGMLNQFRSRPGLTAIERARLLVHEERPEETAAAIVEIVLEYGRRSL